MMSNGNSQIGERTSARIVTRLCWLVAVFVAWLPGNLAAQSNGFHSAPAMLQPGDVLRITVYQHTELSGEFMIGADSTIRHVLYRTVKVVGVPLSEVEERLKRSMIGTYFNDVPPFIVEPLLRITIGGEIRAPNLYTLPRETSIGQAVALAGGPTERGRLDRVRLVRDGRVLQLDLTDPEESWAIESIRSGDQIVIDRRSGGFGALVPTIASLIGAIAAIASLAAR